MGSSYRDYMRDDAPQGPTWGQDVPTTKWLLIVTVGVFFLQNMFTHAPTFVEGAARMQMTVPSYVDEWFSLDADKISHGQVWRLITYVFCHSRANPFGLVFNMLALWFLGSALERMYGSRELLWFYLAAGLVCGIVFTLFNIRLELPMPLMGSSPCVMALFTLYATHFPRQEILFCWLIPVQIRVLLFIYIALDVLQILQAAQGHAGWVTVAYMSDLWGIAFGYLYRRCHWHLSGLTDMLDVRRLGRSMRRAQTARNLKVFQPEPTTSLEEQVDTILAKIHEQGSESLTDRERSILQRASDQAKNRL